MNFKAVFKAIGMAAAGGAIGGAIQQAHSYVDPQSVQITKDLGHQFALAAGAGALSAVVGLFTKRPQDSGQ